MPNKTVDIANSFWSKVKKGLGCWEYQEACFDSGYGKFMSKYAHRVAWELSFGEIPDGLWVLHKCDNPPCCNPKHLFLGTQVDNMRDAKNKGRFIYERCRAGHLLTEGNVRFQNGKRKGCAICYKKYRFKNKKKRAERNKEYCREYYRRKRSERMLAEGGKKR